MKANGKFHVEVQGRISSVSWLEQALWNARKVRGEKYFQYELVLSQEQLNVLEHELDEVEKVWTKESPLFEYEAPHPAYAGFAEVLKQARYQRPGGKLMFPGQPDNDECQEFCEIQIQKAIHQLEQARKYAAAQEATEILREVEKRGGEAYAEYKSRLQTLNR